MYSLVHHHFKRLHIRYSSLNPSLKIEFIFILTTMINPFNNGKIVTVHANSGRTKANSREWKPPNVQKAPKQQKAPAQPNQPKAKPQTAYLSQDIMNSITKINQTLFESKDKKINVWTVIPAIMKFDFNSYDDTEQICKLFTTLRFHIENMNAKWEFNKNYKCNNLWTDFCKFVVMIADLSAQRALQEKNRADAVGNLMNNDVDPLLDFKVELFAEFCYSMLDAYEEWERFNDWLKSTELPPGVPEERASEWDIESCRSLFQELEQDEDDAVYEAHQKKIEEEDAAGLYEVTYDESKAYYITSSTGITHRVCKAIVKRKNLFKSL